MLRDAHADRRGASHDDWRRVLTTLQRWGAGTAVTAGAALKAGPPGRGGPILGQIVTGDAHTYI